MSSNKPTVTHYESRILGRVYLGGIQVGTVETTKRLDGVGREVKHRGWCAGCDKDVDINGAALDDFDAKPSRYHASEEACVRVITEHALRCDAMIVELARFAPGKAVA